MRPSAASGTGVIAALLICLPPQLIGQDGTAPPSQDGYLTGADGVRLYYRTIGNTGEPLIVLHGTPGHMQAMEPYFEPLARRHTLIFYDQRGGGRSEVVVDSSRLTWQDHVRDLEAVRRHFQLDEVSLLGKSWGSGLATLYAAEHPDRVERLVLLTMRARHDAPTPPDLGAPPRDPAVSQRLAAMETAWEEVDDIIAHCRTYWELLTRESAYRSVWEDMCNEPPEAVRNHNRIMGALGSSLGEWDWRPVLRRIQVPALVIKDADAALAVHHAREWVEALPHARLLLIPNTSGAEWVDNPDAFFSAVDAFLNGAWPERAESADTDPIIDMHMHAMEMMTGPDGEPLPLPCLPAPCDQGAPPEVRSGSEILRLTVAAMDRHNIVHAVLSDGFNTSTEDVYEWAEAAPGRFIPSAGVGGPGNPEIEFLRQELTEGRIAAIGEIGAQYSGMPPNHPALDPYFALAEEFDVPVLIHALGIGAPVPSFRSAAGNPLLLEDVLVRHPGLRLYVENAGYPYLEEMIAVMYQYPGVYADLSTITWLIPREAFHDYLSGLMRAGLGKRLMFGSDQASFPEAIDIAVGAIESASFLTESQKRDIFYNNAARFLRLDRGPAIRPTR